MSDENRVRQEARALCSALSTQELLQDAAEVRKWLNESGFTVYGTIVEELIIRLGGSKQ